jgi:hypothetical protein
MALHEAERSTSDVEKHTSNPPRGVSIQAFRRLPLIPSPDFR